VTVPPPVRQGTRFLALDGLRGAACYMVIATHVGFESGRSFGHGIWAPWLSRFDVSVPIFLMLSGFLLYRPFAANIMTDRPAPNLWSFWWRRALRVLPAYWLAVVVIMAVLSERHATWGDWASYLGMAQIYNDHQVDPSMSQLWTVCTEVAFYVALPLLAALATSRRGTVDERFRRQVLLFAGLLLVSIAWQITSLRIDALGYSALDWLPSIIDWFAVGMFLALLTSTPPECTAYGRLRHTLNAWAQQPALCWSFALIVFWFVTLPVGGPLGLQYSTAWEWLTRHHLETVVVFFLMVPLTLGDGGVIGKVLSHRVARYFGEISYGLYLWHLAMLVYLQRVLRIPLFQGHFWEFFALTAGSATVLGSLSYYLLERPLLRKYSRPTFLIGRGAGRSAANTTAAAASSCGQGEPARPPAERFQAIASPQPATATSTAPDQ
jgi:peptidoglycan/LPS O-acetylase OafA/YrhL